MKPRIIFADPEAAIVNYLADTLKFHPEPYVPATIKTSTADRTLVDATHAQVELEVGNADDYPVTERAQVRVTCYAPPGRRSDVKDLASLAQAFVYSHPGSETVAGCTILVGRSDVITDPDTKNLMCWFLARVDLKAILLAS